MANTRKTQKTQKTQKTMAPKGQPSLNPDTLKPNTVRRGVDGYWWTVIKTEDVRWLFSPRFMPANPDAQHTWMPIGDHSTKNGKTRHKRMKLEMTDERKKAMENDGIITVAFDLTPACEKSGKLPKRCDLEHEASHASPLLQKTAWTFGLFDYATAPTDLFKYIHTYEGPLTSMEATVAALKKHYTAHTKAGAISTFRITTETNKDLMKRHYKF